MKPTTPEAAICLHCDAELREGAVFCDRCGTMRAPRTPAPPVPRWGLVIGLVGALGAVVGAGAGFWLGWRTAPVRDVVRVEPQIIEIDRGATTSPPPVPVEPPDEALDAARSSRPADANEVSPDGTSTAQDAPYRTGAMRLAGITEDDATLPRSPAIAVGPSHVLAPLSAIEGATRASVRGRDGQIHDVLGVARYDAAYDLALLEVAGEVVPTSKGLRGDAIVRQETGALIATDERDASGEETMTWFAPGDPDPFTGGPRLKLESPAKAPSVLVDDDGRVVGLVPGQDGRALTTHVAAAWVDRPGVSVPLERFRAMVGQLSGGSRLREAQRLLAQRRYGDAARAFLDLLAVEPQRLDEARADLVLAVREAARESTGAGQPELANTLLAAALARVPDAAELHAARGRALGALGDAIGAVDALMRAGQFEPERAATWVIEARGILLDAVTRLRNQGRLPEALGLLANVGSKFENDGGLLIAAGEIAFALRQFAYAADLFGKAARVDTRVASEAAPRAQRAADLAGGPGSIVLDFAPNAAQIIVSARVNGSATLQLRIDAGQRDVVLTQGAARAAGYTVAALPRVRNPAEPSADEIPTAKLQSLTVSGVSANGLQVIVNDTIVGAGADGVLGQTWLNRFRVVEDRSLGRMVLWSK